MRGLGCCFVVVTALGAGAEARAEEAQVRLSAEPDPGDRQTVTLALSNPSDRPVVVYLDARLATVELRRQGRRAGRCSAPPGAARAGDDPRRFVRLAPGERATERLDLRFLCFGAAGARLAEADAVRIGYRSSARSDQAGRPAVTARLGPVEVALPARPEPDPDPPGEAPAPAIETAAPVLRLARVGPLPDVPDGERLPVTLEVGAPPGARLPVVVRPDLFAFEVRGPGVDGRACTIGPSPVRPLRDFYERLGRARMGLDLARLCPAGTFARAGVYVVVPRFGSPHDGRDVGLEAWTGSLTGEPFLVRVRRAARGPGEPVEIEGPAAAGLGRGGGDAL